MIRFVTDSLRDKLLSAPIFCPVLDARIRTLYKIYGTDGMESSFWIQEDESGKVSAAISLCGGHMNLSAGSGYDIGEIGHFLSFMGGYASISLPESAKEALPPDAVACKAFAVLHKKDSLAKNDTHKIVPVAKLSDVYAILRSVDIDFSRRSDWEHWYVHASRVIRRGLGVNVGVYVDGALVSTGGVYASGAGHALISGVATLPEHRGCGYAGAVVNTLAVWCVERGFIPVLLTESENLAEWYGSMGFIQDTQKILEAVYEPKFL